FSFWIMFNYIPARKSFFKWFFIVRINIFRVKRWSFYGSIFPTNKIGIIKSGLVIARYVWIISLFCIVDIVNLLHEFVYLFLYLAYHFLCFFVVGSFVFKCLFLLV